MTIKNKMTNFLSALDYYGDDYFSIGSYLKDYKHIKQVLEYQGYYSGLKTRYYFDDNLNVIYTMNRWQ